MIWHMDSSPECTDVCWDNQNVMYFHDYDNKLLFDAVPYSIYIPVHNIAISLSIIGKKGVILAISISWELNEH